MNTSEVLNRAADLIEERGWVSGKGWDWEQGGPLCLEGGILAATGLSFQSGGYYSCPAYKAVREYLSSRTDKSPWLWNDHLVGERVDAALAAGQVKSVTQLEVLRAELNEWAKNEVVSVLRAAAVIEAAKQESPIALAAVTVDEAVAG